MPEPQQLDLINLTETWSLLETRILPDGSVAGIHKLMFTWAVFFGLTEDDWTTRFCFKELVLAKAALREADSADFEPEGYVAVRR